MYGIRVPIVVNEYVWVIDDTKSTFFDLQPLLFETEKEAKEYAKLWGDHAIVKKYCAGLV